MTERWILKQTEALVSQWDRAIEDHYPQHVLQWRDPLVHLEAVNNDWNLLAAAELIEWPKFIGPDCKILDIGAGTGWLSAYISRLANVGVIYALDSSEYFLEVMMPEIFRLMNGEISKIVKIEGLFAPLLFEEHAFDLVVASSSLHHAADMQGVLGEVKRVLRDDGVLLILNETPETAIRYILAITRQFFRIFLDTALRRYKNVSPQISSSGYLYDPYLGDKRFPLWYWQGALNAAGFTVDLMVTDYYTNKHIAKGPRLTHFICKKNRSGP